MLYDTRKPHQNNTGTIQNIKNRKTPCFSYNHIIYMGATLIQGPEEMFQDFPMNFIGKVFEFLNIYAKPNLFKKSRKTLYSSVNKAPEQILKNTLCPPNGDKLTLFQIPSQKQKELHVRRLVYLSWGITQPSIMGNITPIFSTTKKYSQKHFLILQEADSFFEKLSLFLRFTFSKVPS